ncbi:hypothetical protein [Streptomyces abyssomicinicus]|uniref:hypothetical protein n=1 Tax=Streptomyces abyssomicinicus TaxID=574929 RepID=UPI00124FB30A|nr:hypothetical protein [Streptomyces abyssomicinicus]
MSDEQHKVDAYGRELARIGRRQSEAVQARAVVFRALAAVGIGPEQADAVVAQVEAGAVAGAHTWICESSPQAGFEDGWFAGVRDAASRLLRVADTTAAQTGRAASHAMLCAHLHQQAGPAAGGEGAVPATAVSAVSAGAAGGASTVLEVRDVLEAAQRCT